MNHTIKHGMYNTPEYRAWQSMWTRCTNTRTHYYQHYGGRGIAVCDEWKNFSVFFSDIGLRPSASHSLDRIDNDIGYNKTNCRWATKIEQGNNRRDNVKCSYNGETRTIKEWERLKNMPRTLLWRRLKDGWSVERAMQW